MPRKPALPKRAPAKQVAERRKAALDEYLGIERVQANPHRIGCNAEPIRRRCPNAGTVWRLAWYCAECAAQLPLHPGCGHSLGVETCAYCGDPLGPDTPRHLLPPLAVQRPTLVLIPNDEEPW